jgi:hypothetical protein
MICMITFVFLGPEEPHSVTLTMEIELRVAERQGGAMFHSMVQSINSNPLHI